MQPNTDGPAAWRRFDPDGALLVNPDDLAALGVRDGDWVAVESPNGRLVGRNRSDESMRRGHIAAPWIRHGLPGVGRRAIEEWATHQSADVVRPS
jgi:anaerobic selenocysteine-containing dehydrogenase